VVKKYYQYHLSSWLMMKSTCSSFLHCSSFLCGVQPATWRIRYTFRINDYSTFVNRFPTSMPFLMGFKANNANQSCWWRTIFWSWSNLVDTWSSTAIFTKQITRLTHPFSIAVPYCEEFNLKYGDATVSYFRITY
jgi:hypothetical protein